MKRFAQKCERMVLCKGSIFSIITRVLVGLAKACLGPVSVGNRTFADLEHAQLEQACHIAVDPKVIGSEMSHDLALKARKIACRVNDAAIVDNGCFDRFDRRCIQCPTAAKTPSQRS